MRWENVPTESYTIPKAVDPKLSKGEEASWAPPRMHSLHSNPDYGCGQPPNLLLQLWLHSYGELSLEPGDQMSLFSSVLLYQGLLSEPLDKS